MTDTPQNPVLYLSVENKSRELASRLLIAGAAVEAGLTVIVGQQWLLNENLKFVPPGVVFFKGLNKVQANNMAYARRRGHIPVANDEEALGLCDADYMMRDVHPRAAEEAALIFAQGQLHREMLVRHTGAEQDMTPIVGSPRLDLLRSEFRSLHMEEAAVIRETEGRYILINSNCASINSAWGSERKYFEILKNIGWLDPEKPEDMKLYEEHVEHDKINMTALRKIISIIRERAPKLKIVVRPHPSEKSKPWEKAYENDPNVKIVPESNHLPWILSSEVLVHAGCTTGMEAELLGCPALSLRTGQSRWHDFYLSNKVNVTAKSAEDGFTILAQFFAGGQDVFRQTQPLRREVLSEYLDASEGDFAFDRLVNVLIERIFPEAPHGIVKIDDHPDFMRKMDRRDYYKKKMSTSFEEVRELLSKLGGLINRFDSVGVKEIGEDLYVLYRK